MNYNTLGRKYMIKQTAIFLRLLLFDITLLTLSMKIKNIFAKSINEIKKNRVVGF